MNYEFKNNTYICVPKLDKNDRIDIEIGDLKQPDFLPQIKMMRWDNEVNFSIRLKDADYNNAFVKFKKNKIVWSKNDIEIEYFDYDEGYKMVWSLKKKPATNKIEFSIQSKGLDFFYQGPLTKEKLKEGERITETDIFDEKGNVINHRPEEVVGSYAVYHQTKGIINNIRGKKYRVGKFCHIYRPKITDTEGKETWGILKIENGIYSVEIPQEFLDKAVYPIKSNDTFGWESIGASSFNDTYIIGSKFTCSGAGNGVRISVALQYADNYQVKCALYDGSKNFVTNGGTEERTNCGNSRVFFDFNFLSAPSLVAADYWIVNWRKTDFFVAYDSVAGFPYCDISAAYNSWPASLAYTATDRRASIHCDYEAAPSSQIKKVSGVAIASVKKISGVANS